MQSIITICARKGSKGLPGKNTKLFNGKPLICWTIETALDWGVGPVIISSDDKKVENIFLEYMSGNIYFDERPANLAMDNTPKLEVLRHVLNKWCGAGHELPVYIVDLDPTNPCRTLTDLNICREIYQENEYKTLISVTEAEKNPFMNQLLFENGKWVTPCSLPHQIGCRQDAPVVFDVNSCIYFYDTEWLMNKSLISPVSDKNGVYVMLQHAKRDINTHYDFGHTESDHRKYYLNG